MRSNLDPIPKTMISFEEVPALHSFKKRDSSSHQQFFKQMEPFALATQKITGIPASVTLAQAALESGWGRHAPAHNYFGIKGTGPAGSQRLRTREFHRGQWVWTWAWFRKYRSPLESFLDHARLISQNPHFQPALSHTHSTEDFIGALQSGGGRYATDPHYAEKILKIIRQYHLEPYDRF